MERYTKRSMREWYIREGYIFDEGMMKEEAIKRENQKLGEQAIAIAKGIDGVLSKEEGRKLIRDLGVQVPHYTSYNNNFYSNGRKDGITFTFNFSQSDLVSHKTLQDYVESHHPK